MTSKEFATALAIKFTKGLCDRKPQDGFSAYQLSKMGLELDGNESDGTFIKSTRENENLLFNQVTDFIINLRIGMEAADVEIPAHINDAFFNDVEFNDFFVSLVMKNG